MGTLSICFYYQEDVRRWEALERRGKLGPRQRALLRHWRALKQKNPDLKYMETWTGQQLYGAPTEVMVDGQL